QEFRAFKNFFTDPSLQSGLVSFHFDDGATTTTVDWKLGSPRPSKSQVVANTALRLGCIDYRALLQTNFAQQGNAVNLFKLAVEHLVQHYPVTSAGRSTTVGELWKQALSLFPKNHRGFRVAYAKNALKAFNEAFVPVVPVLATKAEELLTNFPGCDFKLTMDFAGVDYDMLRRTYTGQELILQVHSKGSPIPAHHLFLNEARLSAIALAIFFAGLLVSIPAPVPGTPQYPKMLVLDDVLIGLDMENRIPVLDIIKLYFSDWQAFIFTHDKVWKEIVRLDTQEDSSWCYHELYKGESPNGVETPILRPGGRGWDYFLDKARKQLAGNDEQAAAVHARSAFEGKIKNYCDKKNLPVKYRNDPRRIAADDFWQAATKYALEQASADPVATSVLTAMFKRIEMYRKIVLNPLSHSAPVAITNAEIQGAIDAVADLKFN